MQLGVHYANFTLPGGPGARLADAAPRPRRPPTRAAVALFTVMDHWFQMEQFATPHDPMLEGYTDARLPRRADRADPARPAGHRRDLPPPGPAREDRHHARRAVRRPRRCSASAPPGTSASTTALGVPFPPISERFERLEETLQICLQMWSDDDGPYEGKHYQLAETICVAAADPAAAARRS